MHAEPQNEHRWLEQLLGDWTMEGECAAPGPDQQPMKSKGKEHVRSLGGLWIVGEGEGEMPGGGNAEMLLTIGFDPQTKKFRGSWVGSMMTHQWVYEGELDPTGKILTLNAEGPSFVAEGKTAKYQDIFEIVDKDHRILRSQSLGDDGKWTQFMTAHYYRVK